jgi:hypothetical protein
MNDIPQPLATWKKSERAIPLSLAVTSLFSVSTRAQGTEFLDMPLLSREGATIKYSGPSLLVDDMDVLMAVAHVARGSKLQGEVLQIQSSFAELLSILDWPSQSTYYDRLDASLLRLSRAHLDYTQRGGASGRRVTMRVFGTLLGVTETVMTGSARERSITTPISRSMLTLWGSLIQVSWDQRRLLKRSLSRWLQIYVVFGNSGAREYHIEELYEMARFSGEKREFRRCLKDASEELQAQRYFKEFSITRDVAHFVSGAESTNTPAQRDFGFNTPATKGSAALRHDLLSLTNQSTGDM